MKNTYLVRTESIKLWQMDAIMLKGLSKMNSVTMEMENPFKTAAEQLVKSLFDGAVCKIQITCFSQNATNGAETDERVLFMKNVMMTTTLMETDVPTIVELKKDFTALLTIMNSVFVRRFSAEMVSEKVTKNVTMQVRTLMDVQMTAESSALGTALTVLAVLRRLVETVF